MLVDPTLYMQIEEVLYVMVLSYFVPKRNLRFEISFEMSVSKIRPQYGSIDPSYSNIPPLIIILWQNIYLYT